MGYFRFTVVIVLLLFVSESHAQVGSDDTLTSILEKAQALTDALNRVAALGEKVTQPSYLAGAGGAIAGAVSGVVVIFAFGFVFGRHMANVHKCCVGSGSEPV